MKKKCDGCGKEFEARAFTQRFCTPECKAAYFHSPQGKYEISEKNKKWRAKRYTGCSGQVRVCVACGKGFTLKNNRAVAQRFCTEKCRHKYYHVKEKGGTLTKQERQSNIDPTNRAARELGMSYGEYQAMQYLKTHKIKL